MKRAGMPGGTGLIHAQKLSPDLKRKVDEVRAQREGRSALQDKLKVR